MLCRNIVLSRILLAVVLLLTSATTVIGGVPHVEITDPESIVRLNDEPVFLILNEDNPGFSDPAYDDSDWQVVALPSSWTHDIYPGFTGVAWYRLHFRVPEYIGSMHLGIDLGEITDADETYLNGTLIAGYGQIEDPTAHAYDQGRIYHLPERLLKAGGDNVLAIRVRSYFTDEAGPIRGTISIGDHDTLRNRYDVSEFQFALIAFTCIIVSVYFLLFYLRRPADTYALYYALFSLTLGLYIFLRSDIKYLLFDNFIGMKKLEISVLFLTGPFFALFINDYFRKKRSILLIIFTAIAGALTFVVLATREPRLWDVLNTRVMQPLWVPAVVFIFVVLLQNFRQNPSARLITVATVIFLTCVGVDIFFMHMIIRTTVFNRLGMLTGYGSMVFVAGIAGILTERFITVHQDIERVSLQLRSTVDRLDLANRNTDLAYFEAINRLAIMAELRDPETGEHIKRVSLYVRLIADSLGIDRERAEHFEFASLMHDVGKVGIPDTVLFKEGSLSASEWEVMKRHADIGGRLFKDARSPVLAHAHDIALSHHEKWDGSGYPFGLKGEQIALSGRIMAVADVYDALRSKRPYKPELDHQRVVEIIRNGDDRLKPAGFDPQVLKVFLEHHIQFNEIYLAHQD
jgi:HD-GYP domain-containing protein (c-di-GMP phosphodiesterase class II)